MKKKEDELTGIEWRKKEKLGGPNKPKWLQYTSYKYQERYREKLAERELFELRKQLFNAEKAKKIVTGGTYKLKNLRPNLDPNLPHPSLPRLLARCRSNIKYWKREQQKRESEIKKGECLLKKN